MSPETRYDVAIRQGNVVEIRRDLSYRERNRLVDLAYRHDLWFRVTEHRTRVRGEGTYR